MRQLASLLAAVAFTLFGLIVATFLIGRVVPIDPVLTLVGERASAAAYEAARAELGLDRPLYEQFGRYLLGVLRGELGTSTLTAQPVLADIGRVFPATIELATPATVIGVGLGVPLSVLAASRRNRWPDHAVRVLGLLGYSVPVFWLGMMGLLLFYAKLGWVGGPGRLDIAYEGLLDPVTGFLLIDSLIAGDLELFGNALAHIVLPAGVLGYFSLAYVSRMTRSFMLDALGQEYVTTARAKGLSEARVIWLHAFRNVRVPLITVIALAYASLLEGSVLTETVFAWPGLGLYITNALFAADMNAVLGGTLVVGAVFVGVNLLSDALYRFLDPRVR